MLTLDKFVEVFMETSSSNMQVKKQWSIKTSNFNVTLHGSEGNKQAASHGSNTIVKFETMKNGKTTNTNMLILGKHAKVSTVTFSSDLPLRGQRSNLNQRQMAKLTLSIC